ncbi:DinB family protein [Cytobacillus sp. Hz8]|uniref:DinB family protein n=1 Tax=Cytobacillus sp. Hz8 TaxID=3347168 RepID=UPI0035E39791
MLVKNLGETRMKLLESIKNLTDEQLNQKPSMDMWSISQLLYHLYFAEKETAEIILNSLKTESKKVEEMDLSFLTDRSKKAKADVEPPEKFYKKQEITQLLEESRFQYIQAIFNETHEEKLVDKSIEHPTFGVISLKNLLDTIWLHEERHLQQINEIKYQLKMSK